MDVTILDRMSFWSSGEMITLVLIGEIDVETNIGKPNRLVAKNEPHPSQTFQGILGHSDFTTRKVDYLYRWD
jgi:hypothetical protein